MKKLGFVFTFIIFIGANTLFANPIEKFVDSIAYSIFKLAWPTAHYSDVEVMEYDETSYGYEMIIRLKGESSFCLKDHCPLKLDLKVVTSSNFSIEDVSVKRHNAILQPPFKTIDSVADALNK